METPGYNPILGIQPDTIDFGLIGPGSYDQIRTIELVIKNQGNAVLTGHINPQVSWIRVEQPEFNLLEGKSSIHSIIVTQPPPVYWTRNKYFVQGLLMVSSNAGKINLTGSYLVSKTAFLSSFLPEKRLIVTLMAFFVVLSLIGLAIFFIPKITARTQTSPDRHSLLTQGAETVYAEFATQTSLSIALTTTPQPDEMMNETTPIPLSPATVLITPEVTFTPWPRDMFPTPEDLLYSYYNHLNSKEYEQAWSLLSDFFQQSCCNSGSVDPFITYKDWWGTIESVEILSGQIVEPNSNPMEIIMEIQYTLNNGGVLVDENIFSIISDPQTNRLLINEVNLSNP